MRNLWTRRIVGATAVVGLAAWSLSAKEVNPLPEGSSVAVGAADIAFLQKGLSKEPQKREVPTLKAVAMLVALNAQHQTDGKDGAKMAGLRDAALAVAAAVGKKDFAAAKVAAAGLADAKPAAAAKPVKIEELISAHKFELEELMSTFRKGTVGGLNLEADVKAQSKAVTDPKVAAVIAGRIALIGEYTLLLPPEGTDATKKKQWDDWSKEMTDLAVKISTESAKGATADKVKMAKGFRDLDANCNACHTVFRN